MQTKRKLSSGCMFYSNNSSNNKNESSFGEYRPTPVKREVQYHKRAV